jgi:hypothetical protein
MIYKSGYLATQAQDKQFLRAELYGHMDIVSGINASRDVMKPVAQWMHARE